MMAPLTGENVKKSANPFQFDMQWERRCVREEFWEKAQVAPPVVDGASGLVALRWDKRAAAPPKAKIVPRLQDLPTRKVHVEPWETSLLGAGCIVPAQSARASATASGRGSARRRGAHDLGQPVPSARASRTSGTAPSTSAPPGSDSTWIGQRRLGAGSRKSGQTLSSVCCTEDDEIMHSALGDAMSGRSVYYDLAAPRSVSDRRFLVQAEIHEQRRRHQEAMLEISRICDRLGV